MTLPKRHKILVMRYRFIGDTLLTVPFLRNLRRAYPEARIEMLVGPASGEILTHCPYIDELIYFDTTRKHRYENTDTTEPAKTYWHYVTLLKERHYDTAFVLKRSFSSAGLAFLAGIPERIGFNTEGRRLLLTKAVPYPKDKHEVDCFLDILKAAQIPVLDHHLEAWWSDADQTKADHLMQPFQGQKNVLIHISSSNPAKEWPEAYWGELAQWLLNNPTVMIHAVGSEGDLLRYEHLGLRLPSALRGRIQNWCGQTTLLESLALIKQMDFVVGVDSGTLHMAAAVGTPVVSLFGPMDEKKWAPLGEKNQIIMQPVACRPCNLKVRCQHDFKCMEKLELEKVKATCSIHLNS